MISELRSDAPNKIEIGINLYFNDYEDSKTYFYGPESIDNIIYSVENAV